jgi:hypothetical protein
VNALDVAGPVAAVGSVAAHLHAARWLAAGSFLALLLALTFGLLRAKKQVLHEEAEAALEADFQRLERELAAHDAAGPAAAREGTE